MNRMLQLVFCPFLKSTRARILMCTRVLAPGFTLLAQHRASSQILFGTATPDTQPEFEGGLLKCGRHGLPLPIWSPSCGARTSLSCPQSSLGRAASVHHSLNQSPRRWALALHGCFINLFCCLYLLLRGNCYIFTFPLEITYSALLEGGGSIGVNTLGISFIPTSSVGEEWHSLSHGGSC